LGERRLVPALGLLGCAVLAVSLPLPSVLGGTVVLALGIAWWFTVKILRRGNCGLDHH
jgi:APA family basic amino acid/polyamine antiporter